MKNLCEVLEELNSLEEDWNDFNDVDEEPKTESEIKMSNELFSFLQSLIETSDIITEEFLSKNCLNRHYKKHCLAGNPNKKSTMYNVYYDFTAVDKYRNYGDEVTSKLTLTKNRIVSLADIRLIEKLFRKFFEGNQYVLFTTSCGFKNNSGWVAMGLHSFSSNVTKNYNGGNTVDLVLFTPDLKTISIYPIDAYYLETKLNNTIKTHGTEKVSLKINQR